MRPYDLPPAVTTSTTDAHGDEPGGVDIRQLEADEGAEFAGARSQLVRIAVVAALAGALTGLVGACFREVLIRADHLRLSLAGDLRPLGVAGYVISAALVGVCAASARALVRLAPQAGGSGVQRVEAVMRGEATPAGAMVLPVKFLGGALALGSGLALGREGPTVQMGAIIGDWFSTQAKLATVDLRRVQAAVAGAGLAIAFSAPIGGAVFVFEEVARSTTVRLIVATLAACASAIAVGWLIIGTAPVYRVIAPPAPHLDAVIPVIVFGAALGAFGVGYNRLIVALLAVQERLAAIPPEVRAAGVGAIVGVVLLAQADLVTGGDALNQHLLDAGAPLGTLALYLALRTAIGPLSYSAGTPGGLFAPLLLIGTLAGTLFADAANQLIPSLALNPVAFSIIGMSTFFTAVVRSPLTGIMLIVEMTATTSQAVPMLGAAAVATLVATLLGGQPIYDTLRHRMLEAEAPTRGTRRGEGDLLPSGDAGTNLLRIRA